MPGAVAHRVTYPFESQVDPKGDLRLATARGLAPEFFFEGRLLQPRRTGRQLRALMQVVHARHHMPPAMLERILMQSDPVVTANDDQLRFEGFSACCGVYARLDLLGGAFADHTAGRGTTNVDFSPPMLNALSQLPELGDVALSIGASGVRLDAPEASVIERKVTLPVRWLRGFVEAQAVQGRMKLVHEIGGLWAQRFLRGLPRMKTNRRKTFVDRAGDGLRLTQVERPDSVAVGGLERLWVLQELAPLARRLRVYSDPVTQATAWVLDSEHDRFTLALSPEVWRGFSGEGQVLDALANRDPAVIAAVRADLTWRAVIDADATAARVGHPVEVVSDALHVLASRGVVGFDVFAGRYFHRELPFDLDLVEQLQPRLRAARELLEKGAVRVEDARVAYVHSGTVEHRVVSEGEEWACSCPWFAKHQGDRGPCKHVLAVQLQREGE